MAAAQAMHMAWPARAGKPRIAPLHDSPVSFEVLGVYWCTQTKLRSRDVGVGRQCGEGAAGKLRPPAHACMHLQLSGSDSLCTGTCGLEMEAEAGHVCITL